MNCLHSWEAGGGDSDCCNWTGVGCDTAGAHVIKLELRPFVYPANGSTGYFSAYEVSPYLLKLKYLNHLDLSGIQQVNATRIPKFIGSMKQLKYLNLSYVKFQGPVPHHLGNLTILEVFDLRENYDLFFDDVKWISRMVVLKYLDMSRVNLSRTDMLLQVLDVLPNSLSHLALAGCDLQNSPLPHGRVIIINSTFLSASYNNFSGSIPPDWLEHMKSLRSLDLLGNSFFGPIPNTLGTLSSLTKLDLSYNSFFGPIPNTLGTLSSLTTLDLSHNSLSGPIPNTLGTLSSLTTLDLSYNSLSGPIPNTLGTLNSLTTLDLSVNSLSGPIPNTLGTLSSLTKLDLSYNQFEGVISEVHFANLSQLKYLDISNNNQLVVQLDSTWVPPFQLTNIYLSSCKFIGFPQWIQTQKDATQLDLSNASISGDMPKWLGTCSEWYDVDLSQNNITGMVGDFPSVINLDLSHNRITGLTWKFSSNISFLDLSYNQISGVIPLDIEEQMPNLNYLFLNDNHINGSIPPSMCNLTSLSILDLSTNEISGTIPNCWNSNSSYLFLIHLSSNYLSGSIPSSMRKLQGLQSLHLNNNNLQGKIPNSLRSLHELKFLDLGENELSGDVPTWMRRHSFPFVRTLRLRDNHLSGSLPFGICSLSNLQILDVAINDLGGNIPHCVRHLNGMTPATSPEREFQTEQWDYEKMKEVMKGAELEYTTNLNLVVTLDLSCNNFVGSVPKDLTLLTGLVSLNLSHNLLSGNIPYNIGNMKNLESLDFSNNELSGTIPSSISALTFLSHLNLSNNHLQGRIPKGNQLDTIYSSDHSIYDGNPQLCGEPLSKQCPGDGQPLQPPLNKQDEDQRNASDKLILYIVVILGFGIGLWGVIGALMFKKTWRAAYFKFVEDTMYTVFVAMKVRMAKFKRRMSISI